MEEMLKVGVITSTHGVRGEVKVFPTTDDPARFKKSQKMILDTGKEKLPLTIQNVKFFKQFVILKFEGFNDINAVEKYKKCPLLVNRKDAVPLLEDEYFIADMIGLTAVTEDGEGCDRDGCQRCVCHRYRKVRRGTHPSHKGVHT